MGKAASLLGLVTKSQKPVQENPEQLAWLDGIGKELEGTMKKGRLESRMRRGREESAH